MSDREKARPALIIFISLEYITSFAVAWLARSSFFEASGRLPMFSNFVRAT
jgi:DNA-binding transcriptional regulator of glucitol operon